MHHAISRNISNAPIRSLRNPRITDLPDYAKQKKRPIYCKADISAVRMRTGNDDSTNVFLIQYLKAVTAMHFYKKKIHFTAACWKTLLKTKQDYFITIYSLKPAKQSFHSMMFDSVLTKFLAELKYSEISVGHHIRRLSN